MMRLFAQMSAALLLLFAATAYGQLVVTADVGQQKTTYGSSYDTAYMGHTTDVGAMTFAMGGALFGHSQRLHGLNFYVGGDLTVPFSNDAAKGGSLIVGGLGQANYRFRSFTIGSGLDLHSYTFASDSTGGASRPNQLLVSVPVVAKYSFGPAGRAFVQGGGAITVTSIASNVVTDSLGNSTVVSTAKLDLSPSHTSGDIRASAGYMFGRLGLRASYINRDAYFNASSNPTAYKSFYDFHQNSFTGGLIFSMF